MSCNVEQYLPPNDKPNSYVEDLVHSQLTAVARDARRRRRRSLRPPGDMEFVVFTSDGRILSLIAYRNKQRNYFVELHHQTTALRKLHTHDGHKNPPPKSTPVPGPHMHFPSEKYPLVERSSSYAYPLNCLDIADVADGVVSFCHQIGIQIDAVQMHLQG